MIESMNSGTVTKSYLDDILTKHAKDIKELKEEQNRLRERLDLADEATRKRFDALDRAINERAKDINSSIEELKGSVTEHVTSEREKELSREVGYLSELLKKEDKKEERRWRHIYALIIALMLPDVLGSLTYVIEQWKGVIR